MAREVRFLSPLGPARIVRIVGAGFSLGYAIIVALGSGLSDVAEVLGLPLTPAQRVLAATFLFGAFMLWDNYRLQRKLIDHSTSPRLTWSDPKAERLANGTIHLEVWCENTGPTESVAILRGGRAWTSAGELVMPVAIGSPINSSKIDQQKHRWRVEIDSPPNVQFSTGTHVITWMLIYFDNARPNTHGYLTQETLSIEFTNVGTGEIKGPYWLDATSTNEDRYRRYWKLMRESATAGKQVTGIASQVGVLVRAALPAAAILVLLGLALIVNSRLFPGDMVVVGKEYERQGDLALVCVSYRAYGDTVRTCIPGTASSAARIVQCDKDARIGRPLPESCQ